MKRVAAILFLMSLATASAVAHAQSPAAADDAALLGMRLFNQSCRVCHTPPHAGSVSYGPALTRDSLGGQEEALRAFVANGSARMPGFKSHFRPEEIAAVIAYLKTLPPPEPARQPESD